MDLLRFLAYGNFIVAFSASCIAYFVMHSHNIYNWSILGFVFCSTIFTYTFQRILPVYQFKEFKIYSEKDDWLYRYKKMWLILLIISCGGCLYLIQFVNIESLLFLVPFVFASMFYSLKTKKFKGFRNIPGIKIFTIGITWAAVGVGFTEINLVGNIQSWGLFTIVALQVIGLTIPFDVKDLKKDSKKMYTIPQLIGVQKSIWIAVILTCLVGTYTALYYESLISVAATICSALLILYSRNVKSDLYYLILLDLFIGLQFITITLTNI